VRASYLKAGRAANANPARSDGRAHFTFLQKQILISLTPGFSPMKARDFVEQRSSQAIKFPIDALKFPSHAAKFPLPLVTPHQR
jgi:hypothetical protein